MVSHITWHHRVSQRKVMCEARPLVAAARNRERVYDKNCSKPHCSYLKVKVLKAECLEEIIHEILSVL